jgi:CelD/BcsL family acetyltransferase involved in cellulose biosynthesis
MLKCRLVQDYYSLAEISEAWDGLVRKSEFNDVFATFGFARAWWRAYGKSRKLQVVVVEDEFSRPHLIAPFYSEASAPGVWKLIGNFRADYNNLIHAAGDSESLLALFNWLKRQPGWHRLELNRIPGHVAVLRHFPRAYGPESSNLSKILSWLSVNSPLVYRRWHKQHPRIDRQALERLKSLLEQQNYRRQLKWLQRHGGFAYRCARDAGECLLLLPMLVKLHIRNWEAKGQRSLFLDTENQAFYRYLIDELAPYNAIRMDVLELNGKMIAAHFGFVWDQRIYYYKSCYDPDHSGRRPGKILLAYIIRDAWDSEAMELDLLNGNEEYKMKYASDIRTTGSLRLYRSRLSAAMA